MKAETIAITGLGMVSSLGLNVINSCAAARAGIFRANELDYLSIFEEESGNMVPVTAHTLTGFAEGFQGVGRIIRLGDAAIADLIGQANLSLNKFSKVGLFLNLSNSYFLQLLGARERKEKDKIEFEVADGNDTIGIQAKKKHYERILSQRLCTLNKINISDRFQKLYFDGHAGIVAVIRDTMDLLQRGELDLCIVGGIDSYVDQEVLQALYDVGVLKTVENTRGFSPGEAAAFILIERYDNALQRNAKIMGTIESTSLKTESTHRFSGNLPLGLALSDVILHTLNGLDDRGKNTGLIIGDINGDEWKAREWGYAQARLPNNLLSCQLLYPAESFGDVGAATGVLSICLGVQAFQRNYAKTDNILIWLSDYDGNKGAFYLRNV